MEFENENINEQPVSENTDEQVNDNVSETQEQVFEADAQIDCEREPEDVDTDEQTQEKNKKSILKEIMDWIISIALAIVIALVIRNYVFTLVRVDGNSMLPTLHHGETLYTNRFMYQPENGDIVIFHPRHNPKVSYVKRVIALEGQTVYIDPETRTVSVDGVVLDEPYIGGADTYPSITGTTFEVPEDHVFVLGDNRNNSSDSRDPNVGFVSIDSILGEAVFRLLPLSEFGTLK